VAGRAVGGISIEIAVEAGGWAPEAELRAIAERAVEAAVAVVRARQDASRHPNPAAELEADPQAEEELELSLLFTDDAAIRELNRRWRGKDKPTNVLSFPQASPEGGEQLLGDIVLGYDTVASEAALAGKPLQEHMAHLIVHGFLHLIGYDHEAEDEAEAMEELERVALASIGIPDPYAASRDI
jgi:probable rRNA maturation factor